jgi:hypothetical protein
MSHVVSRSHAFCVARVGFSRIACVGAVQLPLPLLVLLSFIFRPLSFFALRSAVCALHFALCALRREAPPTYAART